MSEKNKKILIVEDEKPLANALRLKFQKAGIEAEIAENGAEALQMIEVGKFDLVLLDLIMPEKDGFTVLEELNKKEIKIPVVVASNLGQQEDISRSMELGAKDYIIKSNTPIVEIVNKIKVMLFK